MWECRPRLLALTVDLRSNAECRAVHAVPSNACIRKLFPLEIECAAVMAADQPPLSTCNRVLGAYQYVPDDAAFVFRDLFGETWPDPAALATTEGIRQSRQLHKLVTAGRKGAGRRRRLVEGPAVAAARQRLAELAAEGDWEEGSWFDGKAEELDQSSSSSASSQQQPTRRLAAKEQPSGKPKRPGKKGAQDDGEPPAGSYAAAMLRALDKDASRAGHTAAWRAKRKAMERNVETARQVLRETAAWAAAAASANP